MNNFRNPREPQALELLPQDASRFRQLLSDLIDQLLATFPATFEHPAYQQKKIGHRLCVQPPLRQGH